MSVEIDIISPGVQDVPVAARVADLVLGHCLNGYTGLELDGNSEAMTLKEGDAWLTAVSIPSGYHEFADETVVSVRSERRNSRSYLTCLIVSSALAYCFLGRLDLDNWISKSVAEPAKILAECLRHADSEAQWLLDRLAEVE